MVKSMHIILLNPFIYCTTRYKIFNDSILLLITPNGKERKTTINDFKPYSTTELVENAGISFLSSIKTKCLNYNCSLRSCSNSKFKV